ncbi:unnamed protein product [Owenia fusiformis]|uniref:sphingomyelin phosphodiesterase n=1 Tax=Owenia fusiformis TaxID=6347 RepID=A0A8J1U3J4_OWEFU|nr:unnamed protein product [Owenia fusiformis]
MAKLVGLAGVLVFTLALVRGLNAGQCFVGEIFGTEDDVAGTCTKTCPEASGNTGRAGCDRLSNCRHHMEGWTRGFVRCDICKCDCYKNCQSGEKCRFASGNTVSRTYVEPDLNSGSCTKTCSTVPKQFDKFGCKEIKNCRMRQQGWLRGFVHCGICQCDCVLPTIDPLDLAPGRHPGQCYGDSSATTPPGGPTTTPLPEQPTRRPCGGVEGGDCGLFGLQDNDGSGFCNTENKRKCVAIPTSSKFTTDGINTLNVMSYNIFERRFAISHDGQVERTCRIPKMIAEKFNTVDVVVFQEVFMGGCWPDINMRELLNFYGFPYTTETIDGSGDFLQVENGGVFIASRWPIVESKAHVYAAFDSFTADRLSKKGVMYAQIRKTFNGASKSFHIFGTHMQAEKGASTDRARVAQAREMNTFRGSLRIPSSEPVIYAGDFNVDKIHERTHANDVMGALDATVPAVSGALTGTLDTNKNELARLGKSSDDPSVQWLDYVVYNNKHQVPRSVSMVAHDVKADQSFKVCWCEGCILKSNDYLYPGSSCSNVKGIRDLSDHFPVTAKFVF